MTSVVILADTHSNHKMGLNPPEITLEEGDTWGACEIQKITWNSYMDCIEKVKKIKGEKIGIVNGDYIDIDEKNRTNQIISRDEATISSIGGDVIDPLARLCKKMYFVRGTEAHVGKGGAAEELIASDFTNAVVCPETKKKSWWYLPLEVEGVRMDIAHHPQTNGGGRPFNTQGAIDRLASDTLFMYANRGDKPPDLVIRSHIHRYLDSRDAFRVRAIITPPFTLLGAFARRLGINDEPQLGAIAIHCSGGKYEVEPILYQPRRTVWVRP
jgi:hypothetical protein